MTKDTTFFAVNYLAAVSFSGDDAATFLQGQLTADVCTLATDEWCRTAYCSPKGRIVATMMFARRDEGYVALMASDLVDELISRLSRFVMRSKVKITRLAAAVDASVDASFNADVPPAFKGGKIQQDGNDMIFDEGGGVCLRLKVDMTPEAGDDVAWRRVQIMRGIPWVDVVNIDVFVPQYINWELLGGVNFRKGCYVGQEIIARLYYLGNVKRRGYILSGDGDMPTGKIGESGAVMDIVNAVGDESGFVAFVSASHAIGDVGGTVEWNGQQGQIALPPYTMPSAEEDKKPRPKV